MGFLRRLFGGKKHNNPPSESNKEKRRSWSFTKNNTRNKSNSHSTFNNNNNPFEPSTSSITFSDNLDTNKHAIAVAAATAAVAEAALAAAHAAAEVVRLTNIGNGAGGSSGRPATAGKVRRRLVAESAAAVKIQSAFRGYLARRALRALKALVKLQALVRGHIVRKQTADMLRRMQTLVRLQSRARTNRAHVPDHMHSFKSSLSHYPVPNDYDQPLRIYGTKFDGSSILKRCSSNVNFRNIDSERVRFGSNWLDSWMEENAWSHSGDASLQNLHLEDERSYKILEVDTWKPNLNSKHSTSSSFQTAQHYLTYDYNNENLMSYESPSKHSYMSYESPSKHSYKAPNQSHSSREIFTQGSSKYQKGREEAGVSRTAEKSPQTLSASSRRGNGSRRGPFTPTKSECSFGFLSGYAGYPSYMANTESSRAKVRSLSAPRQRLEFDRNGSTRRSVQGSWDDGINSDRDSDFKSTKAYNVTGSNRIGGTNLR